MFARDDPLPPPGWQKPAAAITPDATGDSNEISLDHGNAYSLFVIAE